MSTQLQAAIDALFRGALADFTGRRNALAKQLKASGEADDAASVRALTKPSLSAWTLNQLWWHHRAAFDALLSAGDRVRAASARGAGPTEQAAVGKTRRAALTALVKVAEGVLTDGGHAAAASTMRKVTTSLEAAAAYGAAMPDPPLGRRSADVAPPGFDTLASLGAAPNPFAASLSVVPSASPPASDLEPPADQAANDGPSAAALAHQAAAKALVQAQSRADASAREVDALARQADAHAQAADEAKEVLRRAETAVREATAQAHSAEAAAHRARRRAEQTAIILRRANAELRKQTAAVAEATAAAEVARAQAEAE